MARRGNLIGGLLALGGVGLVQSGALEGVLGARDEGYMSAGNPWARDYRPQAARAAAPFRNCDHARAAGAVPVLAGDPGYGAHLDRDRDGVGCEPYYGR